jgi:hypothetical protein
MISDNALSSNDNSFVTINKSFSVLEAENDSLFVSFVNDTLTRPETASGEKLSQDKNTNSLSTSSEFFLNKNLQLASSSDLIISLSILLSDSSSSATQTSMKTNHYRLKLKQSKIFKMTVARKKSE